ncbi:MAG TPA: hypothetical protein VGR95_17380 [Thermoanaerobaculia bacterium]|jgi:mono/diheme cytochrome c family protein|nr:hypothetical protein [Thermoanaerobaculia bacterium]
MKWALSAAALIVTLAAIADLTRADKRPLLTPGAMSSAHSIARDAHGHTVASRCNDCHDPWQPVRDVRCRACHGAAPHAARQLHPPACRSCHEEHSGKAVLASVSDSACTACHHGTAFGFHHPEFEPAADTNTLHFNHADHLAMDGITCASCHKMVETAGRIDPAPLKFATNCQRCHTLNFDARFPDLQVPHGGDPSEVYGYVLTTLAAKDGLSPAVEKKAMSEADDVFNSTCSLCHPVARKGKLMAVTPPAFAAKWMTHAVFSHTDHGRIRCETCHRQARTSTQTADVLMPKQQTCVPCHASKKATTCATCHVYHERSRVALMAGAGPAGDAAR